MSVRAYILLHVTDGKSEIVARAIQRKPGVLIADQLEGPPDLMIVVEAAERVELAHLTVQALETVETMIEDMRLLPTHS